MKQSEAWRYEILYDLPEGEYNPAEVGGTRTKTIRAGDSLEVESFPIVYVSDGAKRERKTRKSGKSQQMLNRINAEKKFRRLVENNFTSGDWVAHPTYDYGFIDRGFCNVNDTIKASREAGYPMDDEEAVRVMRNFIRRLKKRVQQKGGDPKQLKYVYVVEATRLPRDAEISLSHGIQQPGRYYDQRHQRTLAIWIFKGTAR